MGYTWSRATKESKFGSVEDDFLMTNVECLGKESCLWECSHSTTDNCSDGVAGGAGVECFMEPPPGT